MGTIRRLSDIQLGSITTSKILAITSNQIIYTIGSGNRAFELANNGNVALLYYGESNFAAGSGMYINTGGGTKFWDNVVDNFTFALATNSAGATVQALVQEYGGNN